MLLTNGSSFCFDNISSNWLADWLTSPTACSLADQALFGSRRDKATQGSRIEDQGSVLSLLFVVYADRPNCGHKSCACVAISGLCYKNNFSVPLVFYKHNLTLFLWPTKSRGSKTKFGDTIFPGSTCGLGQPHITHCFSLFGTSHTHAYTETPWKNGYMVW